MVSRKKNIITNRLSVDAFKSIIQDYKKTHQSWIMIDIGHLIGISELRICIP